MKKINYKNILYTVLGGIFGLALFISLSGIAGAGPLSGILTTGGGTVGLEQMQISRKLEDVKKPGFLGWDDTVLNENNENSIFRMVGSSMFTNVMSFGQTRFDRLAVGFPSRFSFLDNDDTPKLQVDGYITIKDLAHDGSTQVKACINDFGKIIACAADTYSCTGSTPSNASLCTDDNIGLSADTAKTLVSSCGSPKCEYTCDSGYEYDDVNEKCLEKTLKRYICEKDEKKGDDVWISNDDSCAIPNYDHSKIYEQYEIVCLNEEDEANVAGSDPYDNCVIK